MSDQPYLSALVGSDSEGLSALWRTTSRAGPRASTWNAPARRPLTAPGADGPCDAPTAAGRRPGRRR